MTRKHHIYESIKRDLMSLIDRINIEYDNIYERLKSSENPNSESLEKVATARSTLNVLKDKAPDILQSISDAKDKNTALLIKDKLHSVMVETITAGQIVAELELSETLKRMMLDMMVLGFVSEIGANPIIFLGDQEIPTTLSITETPDRISATIKQEYK